MIDTAIASLSNGKSFNSTTSPLLVSVRSGSAYSMPGMMDTILNVGLNDKRISSLAQTIGEWAAYDSYRRLIQMFAFSVHFSFTATVLNSIPAKLIISINIGSPHLRSFERAHQDDLITISCSLNYEMPYNLGSISLSLGHNHLKDTVFDLTEQQLKNLPVEVQKAITNKNQSALLQLIEKGRVTPNLYPLLIKPKSLAVLNAVKDKILNELWLPPIALPHLMCALDDEIGLSVLEGQGRITNQKVVWCLLYGAKGSEEKEKAATITS